MKIVITNHEFRAHFPSRIHYLYDYLKAHGHELYVLELYGISICYQFSEDHQDADEYWTVLFPGEKNGTVDLNLVKEKMYWYLDQKNPDVVVSGISTFPVGINSLRWAKKHHKAVVEFGDARRDTFKHPWLVHEVKRMMFRNVDAFICPSPAWDESMQFWSFKKEQLFYGLDVANNREWEGKVENINFRNLPDQYICTCSRQVVMKNLPRLLRCYLRYQEEGGRLPLVMVGEGSVHEELVKIADGNKNVIFLPFQNHDRMREIFTRMKALFVPSFKNETWGITVNEAMASGKIAAVSTECGCCSTIIENGKTGFSYDPLDEKAIITTMHSIEKLSSEELNVMQQNALAIVKEWGVEKFASETLKACEYAYIHKKGIRNPIEWLLIQCWKGRMTISGV